MTEQSIIWVNVLLIDKALGKVEEKPKKSKKGSHEDKRKVFSWIRCLLLSGGLADAEISIEIAENDKELPGYKKGEKMTIKTEEGKLLMGNSFEKPPDDLITMTHLHEPAVVYSLEKRFNEDVIYTATGPMLIAINPFKIIGTMYDEDKMKTYWRIGEGIDMQKLEPHIFGFADAAFRQMTSGILEKKGGDDLAKINQAILVSGESGAGKTVTVKFIMKYLASLSSRKQEYTKKRRAASPGRGQKVMMQSRAGMARGKSWMAGAQVEEKILQSGELLESFGNARTLRNDNSSRFGKFIELQFKDTGSLIGARVDTYLLEKVRLVIQMPGERNYHIFYQLLDGATDEEREKYILGKLGPKDFKLTNQSGTYGRRDGVPDEETFEELIVAMGTMGFDDGVQDSIFRVVAGFLHASNLLFEEVTDDSSKLAESNPHLEPVLSLLGIRKEAFEEALCQFEIEAGGKTFNKTVNVEGAEKGLSALISNTFGAMFNYIVDRINSTVDCNVKGEGSSKKAGFIGLLDIFGFEAFESNSFEQLCINYCNEMLQQQFNLFVFKTQQDTYIEEGINWDSITFPDNVKIIDLISKKSTGILSILTDQSRQARGSDKTFASALYKGCDKHPNFDAPSLMKAKHKFVVIHYAGQVEYNIDGFVEKNRDEVPRKASSLLENSTIDLIQLFGKMLAPPVSKSGRTAKRPTAGGQFTKQLSQLKKRITETAPHYIRCLKPNQVLKPSIYNKSMICDQLRYAGVLEAIKVARLGFPSRYQHKAFITRYKFLSENGDISSDQIDELTRDATKQILAASNKSGSDDCFTAAGVQKGKTMIFLTQSAFELLEGLRAHKLESSSVKIQSVVRRFLARCNYVNDKKSIIKCQAYIRGFLVRQEVCRERERMGATAFQSAYRMWVQQRQYKTRQYIALWIQRMARGVAGRKRYKKLYEEHLSKLAVQKLEANSAILLQCVIRARRAKKAVEDRVAREAKQTTELEVKKEMEAKPAKEKPKKLGFSFEDQNEIKVDEETVNRLLKENKSAVLQVDKCAAIAIEEKTGRRKEVAELRKSLGSAHAEVAKSKQALVEVNLMLCDANELREELLRVKEENRILQSRLQAVEAEHKKLESESQPRKNVSEKNFSPYDTHTDLKQLDHGLYNIKAEGKQGKKELQDLFEALANLK